MEARPSASLPLPAAPRRQVEAAAPAARASVGHLLLHRVLPLALLWSIPGLISATSLYFVIQQEEPELRFRTALLWSYPPWLYWALVTLPILALGRRFRLELGTLRSALAVHVPFLLLVGTGHTFCQLYFGKLAGRPYYQDRSLLEMLPLGSLKGLPFSLVCYLGVLAVGYALDYHRRFREGELAQAQLATQLAQAQLDALKMQLHPHFLFNTLNAISVLVRKQETACAVRMLTGVSELLRMALHNTGRQRVPLKQELDFLERYLELEQARFQDRLQIYRHIEPATLDAQVPNLLLQPLVENALKHGISQRAAAGRVELWAARRGDRLHLEVRDDGPGLRPGWEAGEGIGLANVRARLGQLYGSAHVFLLENHPEGGTRAHLELPFSCEEEAA
ncbi:MAG TPA: histidine kinase [Aggregicoccus sp.]|nr:histidine kinase [Aggregicoccus sp.]